jgi:alkylation response protein AidB-like acyl-CoA dehydrogenase
MTTTVTFTTTEEQEFLRATVKDLLRVRATSERVREVMMTDASVDEEAWRELAGLGLTGLLIPEEHGGAGAGFVELSIVLEELGRTLLPVPFLSSAVLGTVALLAAGTAEQLAEHLPEVAGGGTRLALAHLDASGRPTSDPGVHAVRDGDGWHLDGTAGYVIDGSTAQVVVTAATTEDGPALFLVPGDADGLERTPLDVLDLTRPMATLRYTQVAVAEVVRLSGGDATSALQAALTAGAVAIAAEQVGGIQETLARTTAYARDRVQFGRAIGSFQAVKHRLAEMLVASESARSTAYHAARVLALGDAQELAVAAPLAKSYCSEVYETATQDSIQLHGGIAFTWEHDAHLFFKRAKSTKLLLGDPKHHRAVLGDVLGL